MKEKPRAENWSFFLEPFYANYAQMSTSMHGCLAIFGSGSLLAETNKGTATVPFHEEYPGPDSNRHGLYSQRILSP